MLKNKIFKFVGVRFSKKTWSRLHLGVLGPENSDSSSKTTYIVFFPGLNSPIQVLIPQKLFLNLFFINQIMGLVCKEILQPRPWFRKGDPATKNILQMALALSHTAGPNCSQRSYLALWYYRTVALRHAAGPQIMS